MAYMVVNRRINREKLYKLYANAYVVDMTSHAAEPWIRFSPFYPHDDIPVPFSPGYYSKTVEGVWQGLKAFETFDIDISKMSICNMKNIKRSTRRYGNILGHRAGVNGEKILSYLEARYLIYLPTYLWVLENKLQNLINKLKEVGLQHTVICLDYSTNCDINNMEQPLSHAGLVIAYVEDRWPAHNSVIQLV